MLKILCDIKSIFSPFFSSRAIRTFFVHTAYIIHSLVIHHPKTIFIWLRNWLQIQWKRYFLKMPSRQLAEYSIVSLTQGLFHTASTKKINQGSLFFLTHSLKALELWIEGSNSWQRLRRYSKGVELHTKQSNSLLCSPLLFAVNNVQNQCHENHVVLKGTSLKITRFWLYKGIWSISLIIFLGQWK